MIYLNYNILIITLFIERINKTYDLEEKRLEIRPRLL